MSILSYFHIWRYFASLILNFFAMGQWIFNPWIVPQTDWLTPPDFHITFITAVEKVCSRYWAQRGNFGSNLYKMKPRSEKLSCLRRIQNGGKLVESCMHARGKNSTTKWNIGGLCDYRLLDLRGRLILMEFYSPGQTESSESDSSTLAPWR